MERIRTASELEFNVVLTNNQAKYQEIADKVVELRNLGMSYQAIGDSLGVNEKTVRNAYNFLKVSS